jgi:hypothetical protein
MVTPRKLHPKQRGRKGDKAPMFVVSDQQKNKGDGKKLLNFLDQFNDDGIPPVPPMTDRQRYKLNKAALTEALQLTLKEPDRHDQVTKMLHEDGWADAAMFCSYHRQIDALDLKPWQTPPSYLEMAYEKFDDILAKPEPIGDYATVLLTTKLIRHGVSVYSPDPIAALKNAVKQARRGRPPR